MMCWINSLLECSAQTYMELKVPGTKLEYMEEVVVGVLSISHQPSTVKQDVLRQPSTV